MLSLLLKYEAEVDISNDEGETPKMLTKDKDIEKLLQGNDITSSPYKEFKCTSFYSMTFRF